MPEFIYKALDVPDKDAAIEKLRGMGLHPLAVMFQKKQKAKPARGPFIVMPKNQPLFFLTLFGVLFGLWILTAILSDMQEAKKSPEQKQAEEVGRELHYREAMRQIEKDNDAQLDHYMKIKKLADDAEIKR